MNNNGNEEFDGQQQGAGPEQQGTPTASKKSGTGPRTPTGKNRAKVNAITRGLYARAVVMGNELQSDFDALLRGLRRDLKPEGLLEEILVEKIAGILWRYRRFLQAEREGGIRETAAFEITTEYGGVIPVGNVIPVESHFDLLLRSETNLDRALDRALAQLQRLQDMRKRQSGVTQRSASRSTDELKGEVRLALAPPKA
jgi:hypothetical protein